MKSLLGKKIFRLLMNILGVLLILLSGLVWINWTSLQSFPSIISAYYAKEFCSCYFLVGQDKKFCHEYVKQYIPISSFSLDEKEKKIVVTGLGRKSSAKFINKKFGCILQKKSINSQK